MALLIPNEQKGQTMADTDTIPHQTIVTEVIDARTTAANLTQDDANDLEFANRGTVVIATPTADVASLKTAVDAIRAELTAAGVTG